MGTRAQVTMSSNVNRSIEQIAQGLVSGETEAAQQLLAASLDAVPRDTETLANSGRVIPARTPEEGAAVVFETRYAAIVHEKQVKYVEDPAVESKRELGDTIRQRVRGG